MRPDKYSEQTKFEVGLEINGDDVAKVFINSLKGVKLAFEKIIELFIKKDKKKNK
jgi:hypothetical protein